MYNVIGPAVKRIFDSTDFNREESVKMILEHIGKYKGLPVVFTADMNVVEGSENYVDFTKVLNDTKYLADDTMDYLTYHDTKPSKYEGEVINVNIKTDHDAVLIGKGGRTLPAH